MGRRKKGAELDTGTEMIESGAEQKTGTGKKRGRPKGSKSGYTTSDKALAQRQENAFAMNRVHRLETPEEIEYNSRMIQHVMAVNEIAKTADRNDIASLWAAFANYLKLCESDGFKVGNLGVYAALGLDSQTVRLWAKNDNRPEYKNLAQTILRTCSLIRESMISDKKIDSVIGIFWQRNFDGLRNDTEQQQKYDDNTGRNDLNISEYREKYSDLMKD